MKVNTKYIFLTFLGIICYTQAYCYSIEPIGAGWMSISDSAQKMIVHAHKDYITEAAHYFDAKANPVFSLAYDGKEMQSLSDKEFEDYLVKATRYKAGLLRIATQEMLAMKERRTSN